MPTWPDEVQSFLRRALEPDGDAKRYSYAFAASEVGRRFGFSVDRSQVRHWAIAHNLHLADHRARPPAHVRRWQRKSAGELWQPPQDGWWELIWSEWKGSMVGPRGRLLVDGFLCSTECANGTRVWICRHIDGTVSLVLNKPEKGTSPRAHENHSGFARYNFSGFEIYTTNFRMFCTRAREFGIMLASQAAGCRIQGE